MSQDLGRVKSNVSKMIDMGAPEADIDAYLAEEGLTAAHLRGEVPVQPNQPKAAPQPQAPRVPPVENAKSIAEGLFPGANITDWKRDPSSDLGLKNPDSWHVRSGGAVDMAPIPGMTYEQARQKFKDAGYELLEDIDEVKNPSGHATGPHWHFVLGGGPQPTPDAPPPAQANGGGGGIIPSAQAATGQQPQKLEDPTAWLPDLPSWEQTKEGLARGAGNVVEGLASTAGIVADPINVSFSEIFGTQRPKPLGQATRELLGLPEDDSLSGDIQKGVAGGLGGAGIAKALSKLGTGAVSKGLAELGSTPVRDAIAGGTAALGSNAAEELGYGAVGQTVGGVLGGMAGFGGATAAKALTPDARDARFAAKQAAENPFAAYDAEIAGDISKAVGNRAASATDPKGRAEITVKTLNNVEQGYYAQFESLLNRTDLDDISKLKLKEALTRKHSIPQEEVAALRGSVEGNAVADAITKVQRLRQLTPELKRNPGWLASTAKAAAAVADVAPVFGLPGTYGAASIGVRTGLNKLGKITGDGEAARVHAAERLLKRQNAYDKLGMKVGPSGQRESQEALWQKVQQLDDESMLADIFSKVAGDQSSAANDAVRLSKQKEAAWSAKQKMDMGPTPKQRSAQEEAAWRENQKSKAGLSEAEKRKQEEAMWAEVEPTKVPKGQVAEEEAAWKNILTIAQQREAARQAKLKASAPKLDLTPPPEPKAPKAPKPKTLSPEDAAVEEAIANNIRGDGGVTNSFATRLGIDPEDLPKVLDRIEQDLPDLAGEINRIRFNYPTKNRKIGSVIGGRMKAAVEELGIQPRQAEGAPKSVPVDEAAQARLAQTADTPAPAIKPTPRELELTAKLDEVDPVQAVLGEENAPVRASEAGLLSPDAQAMADGIRAEIKALKDEASKGPEMRRISRPDAYAGGKANYQSLAQGAAKDLENDIRISPDTMGLLKRVPETIIKTKKTTQAAEEYIENTIVSDLKAEGVPNEEIDIVKGYLYEIASHKPYYDDAALEKGLYNGPKGRPRKPKD